jgi:hypothetical protein
VLRLLNLARRSNERCSQGCSIDEHSKMVIEHRGSAERDVLLHGPNNWVVVNVEPVLQAGIVNSHDSLLEKTYGNPGSFLMEQIPC